MTISFMKAVLLVEIKILNLIAPDVRLVNLKNTSDPIIYHSIIDKDSLQILDELEKEKPCENNMEHQILSCSTKS